MKIGILTYHLSHNYGAYLQAYALTMRLREELPQAHIELINFNMKVAEKYYKKVIVTENRFSTMLYNIRRYKAFGGFKNQLPTSEIELHSDSIEDFTNMVKNQYDIIIAGSDEIWRLTGSRGFPNPYWLPGKLNCIKMSYAASSRSDFSLIGKDKQMKLEELLNDFSYLGVRDKSTYESVKGTVNDKNKVHMNCDPTLAYRFRFERENGRKILEKRFRIDEKRKTIGLMVTDSNVVKQIKRMLGEEYNYVSLFQKHKGTYSCPDITPFEWIDVISALDFFVTSFFHGLCFGINTGVPFVALEKNKTSIEKSKVLDLLSRVELESRYISVEQITNGELNSLLQDEIGKINDYGPKVAKIRAEFDGFIEAIKTYRIK